MATILPSDDKETDQPDPSFHPSPSISFPIFSQGNEAMAVGEYIVTGESVGGEGVGESVGTYGDDGSKIGGYAITLFGLLRFPLNPKNSAVATIDAEKITRRNTSGLRV